MRTTDVPANRDKGWAYRRGASKIFELFQQGGFYLADSWAWAKAIDPG